MNQVVHPTNRAGTDTLVLSRKAPIALRQLQTGGYAVVIRTSPVDGDFDILRGEIPTV